MHIFTKSLSILLLVCTSLITTAAQSQQQDGYQIDVQINGLSNSDLYLGFHYGNRQFIKDTIRLDENGTGTFKGPEALGQGIYLVITPDKKYFEVLIGEDQHFSMTTDKANMVQRLRFEGSDINQAFNDYQKFMMVQTQKKKCPSEKASEQLKQRFNQHLERSAGKTEPTG